MNAMRCALLVAAASIAVPLGAAEIVLYEHVDFTGQSLRLDAASGSLVKAWNDRASSLRVTGGAWEVCRHAEFRDCQVVEGEVANLKDLGWNDAVSSLRPVVPSAAPTPAASAASPTAVDATPAKASTAPTPVAASAASRTAVDAPPAKASTAAPSGSKNRGGGEAASVNGYAEFRQGDALVVEGQRVVAGTETKIRGETDARTLDAIPLGSIVEASGMRRTDGAIVADRVVAKPNGQQMFESDVKQATDSLEATYRQAGQFLMAAGDQAQSLGKLYEDGPQVERVRRIVDRILPPYIDPAAVRVYVIDNPEWNAMAMGNFSIYVFSGLLDAMDDDEVAIVLGHEIAHASHEHSRKQAKRGMLIQLGTVVGGVAIGSELDGGEAAAAGMLAGLTATAFGNGYSRNHEDQADRVGMRYAHEGGYDVSKGPRLWQKFGAKYGEQDAVTNTIFGSHSRSSVRAKDLEREIAINYPESP